MISSNLKLANYIALRRSFGRPNVNDLVYFLALSVFCFDLFPLPLE